MPLPVQARLSPMMSGCTGRLFTKIGRERVGLVPQILWADMLRMFSWAYCHSTDAALFLEAMIPPALDSHQL